MVDPVSALSMQDFQSSHTHFSSQSIEIFNQLTRQLHSKLLKVSSVCRYSRVTCESSKKYIGKISFRGPNAITSYASPKKKVFGTSTPPQKKTKLPSSKHNQKSSSTLQRPHLWVGSSHTHTHTLGAEKHTSIKLYKVHVWKLFVVHHLDKTPQPNEWFRILRLLREKSSRLDFQTSHVEETGIICWWRQATKKKN